jgi:hypothetical protein
VRLNTPWFYGWNIVGIAIAYQAITYGIAIYGFTFWVPYWETEFDAGRGVIMLIFMSIQIGMPRDWFYQPMPVSCGKSALSFP